MRGSWTIRGRGYPGYAGAALHGGDAPVRARQPTLAVAQERAIQSVEFMSQSGSPAAVRSGNEGDQATESDGDGGGTCARLARQSASRSSVSAVLERVAGRFGPYGRITRTCSTSA